MEKKVYKCLVASPGDTSNERKKCKLIIDEINAGIGDKFGFIVETRMWEDNTRPSFGEYSQAIISEQLGDDYHIFIGIMSNKFGTKTEKAGSGTEEEFNNAYNRLLKKEPVEIMFYFNDEPVKKSEIIVDELNKITQFREKIKKLGGYYWSYNGVLDFESQIRKQLTSYFLSHNQVEPKETTKTNIQFELIRAKYEERLNDALRAFSSQPIFWVDPILSNTNEISQNPDENYNKRIKTTEIIEHPESLVIQAPPQFGLTSLAHYLVKEAWQKGDLWIYLDSHETKAHNIHNTLKREVQSLGQNVEQIKAIVLDSWNNYELDSYRKLKNLSDSYKEIPIILMQTIDASKFLTEHNDICM